MTLGAVALAQMLAGAGGLTFFGGSGFLTLLVGASFASRWFSLSRWATTREQQMEEVSGRLDAALSAADRTDETSWLTLVVGVGALYRECGRHIRKREEVLESLLAPPAT